MIATLLASFFILQDTSFIPPGAVWGQLRAMDGATAVNVRIIAIKLPDGDSTPDDNLNSFDVYFNMPANYTLTDNEGNFRLQELTPGRYFLLAGGSGQGQGTFYPQGATMRDAQVLNVQSGIEIDASFRLKVRLGGKLSGRVDANMTALGPRTATITGGKLEDLLEVPVRPDGTFTFGHIPPGKYLLSLYPPTPGIASMPITIANDDISGAELEPLPTKKVSGRIVVKNGSIPHGLLGFYTLKTWVPGKINEDGTFSVDLHSARQQIDFAGLPAGYTVASVKVGNQDVTQQGIVVGSSDISEVLITLNAPRHLATIKGKVTGLEASRFASTAAVLTGPTFNRGQADVEQDGSFQFDAVVPGTYRLTLNGVPQLLPITINVDSFGTFEVPVNVPSPF